MNAWLDMQIHSSLRIHVMYAVAPMISSNKLDLTCLLSSREISYCKVIEILCLKGGLYGVCFFPVSIF